MTGRLFFSSLRNRFMAAAEVRIFAKMKVREREKKRKKKKKEKQELN